MQEFGNIAVIGPDAIRRVLTYQACIPLVRDAMKALSAGRTLQLLRTFISLSEGRTFGIMPGALSANDYYGAKLVSVFRDPKSPGHSAHRGIVALFESEQGFPVCVADAEEITLIRTASASAVATDALARRDSRVLTVLGCGRQAIAHVAAIAEVRALKHVNLWGRSQARAAEAAKKLASLIPAEVRIAADAEAAVATADIVCTVTSSSEPILAGRWVRPGIHVNLVGASSAAAAEADSDLVALGRYFVDSRQSALVQAGEFLRAKSDGRVTDAHIQAEIGEVLLGTRPGRASDADVTIYKSLGHAVQDLAATAYVYKHISNLAEGAVGKS